ncbi:hypothetical protein K1T35_48345 (plasmid) [Pseudonocardia sp. DSM 110487]|uniref:hypothetical protein n=1 Tax=Pseudonocardia sp. DSM 110487 TaxID=2865833 RepID=UPI001C696593|nr:hypothetical protein [Pseudonocardia sp. DSM 110487]QYN41159.1 hypothetical protein K1T35_48345 [Pseudonocardia sp. DSM 110487]
MIMVLLFVVAQVGIMHNRRGSSGPYRKLGPLQLLSIGAAALLLVSSCGSSDPTAALVGRWIGACSDDPTFQFLGSQIAVEFTEDGRARTTTYDFGPPESRYSVQEDRIAFGDRSGTFSVTDSELRITAFTTADASDRAYWCLLNRA